MVLRFLIRVGRGVALSLFVLTVSVFAATTESNQNQVLIRDIAAEFRDAGTWTSIERTFYGFAETKALFTRA